MGIVHSSDLQLLLQTDWPSQVVYMHDVLKRVADPMTCLNTTVSRSVLRWLEVVDTQKSSWWTTWLVFQPQYYDTPRLPGARIESPATLGRKCWAFAYLAEVWVALKPRLQSRASTALASFIAAYDKAVPFTMALCNKVAANCFVNATYDPNRNGTCPERTKAFYVGFLWENEGGGRSPQPHPRQRIRYPFPTYNQTAAFHRDAGFAVGVALNEII